jgi:hypothetical protein
VLTRCGNAKLNCKKMAECPLWILQTARA